MAHSLLSPSKAARWLSCTPSARMEATIPDQASPYAQEGTLAHAIAEEKLRHELLQKSDVTYEAAINKLCADDLFSEEMLDYVDEYVDFIENIYLAENKQAKVFVEQTLDLSKYVPDSKGTADAVIVTDNKLYICDLKYGKGVKVDAFENPQLKLYALGALDYLYFLYPDIDTVILNIIQPRLSHISTFEISVKDLLDWSYEVKQKAIEAYNGLGEIKAGPWCKFCKCNPNCRALAEHQLEIAKYEFRQPDFLTDKELVDIFNKSKAFKEWIDAVSDYIKTFLEQGGSIKGLKLVNSSTRRSWRDEEADEEAIKKATVEAGFNTDMLYDKPAIKSFSKIERLVGKKMFDKVYSQFITTNTYKAVALESDKREASKSTAAEDFA